MSLVPLQGNAIFEFMLENPFAGNDVGANRARDKISGVVGNQDSKLFFHDVAPVQINEGGADGGGHRRHC
jgi:hypothetical protein